MIGKSVSLCIQDILAGKVKEEDVEKIVGSTRCISKMDWHEVAGQYAVYYWNKDPVEGVAILWRFIEQGKIEQPRLEDPNWYNDCSEKVWEDVARY